ncbi:chitinase CLP-like [Triticum dicoccoides]|uniref:chitinase CLP-like n=1 Tax=Triticum dicoccoides TaxID=85692 RepID=UPI00188E71EE|nr:chitinase CLP-like [Triticum dicoccoides]
MWQPKDLVLVAISLCVLACTVAGDGGGRPLVTAVTRDAATSLYTIPVKSSRPLPLVLDLSGPIVWSTCDGGASHDTLECNSMDCMRAHRFHPPNCQHTGYGMPDAHNPYRCKCTAHPHNPVSGDTASGDMTRVTLSANATDGRNPLGPVSFTAVTSCALDSLLAGLPVGAVGVAGLARSGLAFPAQVSRTQGVANSFVLCLPSGQGNGVAIFGGGPLFAANGRSITELLGSGTPLRKHGESPGYYISASRGIAVDGARVPLDSYAPLTIGFSTTIPYAELRHDVYRPLINAFDQAMERQGAITTGARVPSPAAAPFELCYNSSRLSPTRFGYFVPTVELMLEGGRNWTVFGINSMAQVNRATACFAFVEMKAGDKSWYGGVAAPAVVLGGFQMQQNLLMFDEEKQTLGFTGQLTGRGLSCGHFNFTMPA